MSDKNECLAGLIEGYLLGARARIISEISDQRRNTKSELIAVIQCAASLGVAREIDAPEELEKLLEKYRLELATLDRLERILDAEIYDIVTRADEAIENDEKRKNNGN